MGKRIRCPKCGKFAKVVMWSGSKRVYVVNCRKCGNQVVPNRNPMDIEVLKCNQCGNIENPNTFDGINCPKCGGRMKPLWKIQPIIKKKPPV